MVVVLLGLFTTLAQTGIRFYGQRLAEAAAREGAEAAARFDGTETTGRRSATEYLTQDGAPAITDSQVAARRTATQARVEVTVHVVTLAPWLAGPIRSVATAPVERFVP